MPKKAIIIGAGPAGLTAAYELVTRTDIIPVVLEKSEVIGGISRTTVYKGNRMDMGPHRFFSKSDRVMEWWLDKMPLDSNGGSAVISYQNRTTSVAQEEGKGEADGTGKPKKKMLLIQRLTRIYFLRKFFAYPLKLNLSMLAALGPWRAARIMASFAWARVFQRSPENTLEDFIINKFGKELYTLFFKDYTEKVWGVPCGQISAAWGAQRIKGVSLWKAITEAAKKLGKGKSQLDLSQKGQETSLIEQFMYPQYGPGSLWEEVARLVAERGGEIYLNEDVKNITWDEGRVKAVTTQNSRTGEERSWGGDYFFSTMPVKELVAGMGTEVPAKVQAVAAGLQYRDFVNVGLLLKKMTQELKDNWIYIQEREVKVGRLMVYNNWGGYMVSDPDTVWIGMEYFCNKGDEVWEKKDEEMVQLAVAELVSMELAKAEDVLDSKVQRMEKTYPAYFGTYSEFDEIRGFTDKLDNLFLVGRNGMHKYNNADHSMLTAMVAVDNIIGGRKDKGNIWDVNTEQEYHEEKKAKGGGDNNNDTPKKKRQFLLFPEGTFQEGSFPEFAFGNRNNRMYLAFAGILFLVEFILFKFRYPFANYMPDSYGYLEAAYTNADVNMWPVAYSKFLRLFSVLTHSDKLLTAFQYFFLQASTLALLFTVNYFLRPGKIYRNILYGFFLVDWIPLFIANYISADALFISFSLLWFATLLWILYRPRAWQVWVQGILLLACFTLRYNAIYYPLIMALAFLLAKRSWRFKTAGIAFGILLVGCSYFYTSQKMEAVTGQRQFSAFGGWQLANNALYMYEHIRPQDRGPVLPQFAKLETMVRQYMDTIKKVHFTKEDTAASYFYLWSNRGPLIQYLERDIKNNTTRPYFQRWAVEGPLYNAYGRFLIRKYPLTFLKTFYIGNVYKFFVPPPEFLGIYNMGTDTVRRLAKEWFEYKKAKIENKNSKDRQIKLVTWFPVLNSMLCALTILSIIYLLCFNLDFKGDRFKMKFGILAGAFWILNLLFSTLASPIVLRYQLFPYLISTFLCLLLVELILTENLPTNTKISLNL